MVSIPKFFNCKVFSNEGLFCAADHIPRRPTDLTDSPLLPLSSVILLNSPAASEWEWSEYTRLYSLYRREELAADKVSCQSALPSFENVQNVFPCYFICADGAYNALQKGLVNHTNFLANPHGENDSKVRNALPFQEVEQEKLRMRLVPDVVIGDMDSCDMMDISFTHVAQAGEDARSTIPLNNGSSASTRIGEPVFYRFPSVDEIPDDVLHIVRSRALTATAAKTAGSTGFFPTFSPLFFHIECQMTNDFQKVVALLARLEKLFPLDFPRLVRDPISFSAKDATNGCCCSSSEFVLTSNPSITAKVLSKKYDEIQQKLLRTMNDRRIGAWDAMVSKEDIEKEKDRVASLLLNVAPEKIVSSSEGAQSLFLGKSILPVRCHLLPQIAVLGALGGRFDHEMGTLSCLLQYSNIFHIAITNKENIITACWTDGVTQWLPYVDQITPVSETSNTTLVNTAPPCFGSEQKEGCGVFPMGTVREMETTGLLYNIVKGRPNRCDIVTQTSGYRFAFDGLISSSNTVSDSIVTIDLRPIYRFQHLKESALEQTTKASNKSNFSHDEVQDDNSERENSYNPPTIISCSRK